MSKREDLTGRKFGRLTVIEFYDRNKYGQPRWLCKCDCGNTSIVVGSALRSGATSSCGCLWRERIVEAKTTHGMSRSEIYAEYKNMKKRCYDERNHNYEYYGGRGIKICDRWLDDIHNFYDDVSVLPNYNKEGYTLDRIDNDGDYEPNNVRWSTIKEQSNNRRSNILYEYDGEMHTLQEIADITGISRSTLNNRLKRDGWSPERAFHTEVKKRALPKHK